MFINHKLQENGDGYTLTLYVDPSDTEFAKGFENMEDSNDNPSNQSIHEYIQKNFKQIRIVTVKLMMGPLLIGTIFLGSRPVSAAAGTTAAVSAPTVPYVYKVNPGDTLWAISQRFGVSIETIKKLNNMTGNLIYPGQELKLQTPAPSPETKTYEYYTVVAGDSLWSISTKYGVTIDALKKLNNMTTNTIYPGQKLKVREYQGITYTVKAGDTLYKIAQQYRTTVDKIKTANGLRSDFLSIGQKLFIPSASAPAPQAPTDNNPGPVYNWPDVTYKVQPGDTVLGVARKFNVSVENILKYNYMKPDEWLYSGDTIAISGYAPRVYTVRPGEASTPAQRGKQIDWFLEGQYVLKRGDRFTVVDVDTGRQFQMVVMGGYNHADIEPVTSADTQTMKQLFGGWQWTPRAVVVYKDGMNIAASLSGMPHGAEMVNNNGVAGHFDLYMNDSKPHNPGTSDNYVEQHYRMILKAAGQL